MIKKILLVILIVTLLACGGGGGGGSDSTPDNGNNGGERGIRILHGVLDLDPLNIIAPDGTIISQAEFAQTLRYFKLNEGLQTLSLYRNSDRLNPLAIQNLNVNSDSKYSYFIYGNRSGLGTGAKILVDGYSEEIPQQQVAVRVLHAAVGASEINFQFNQVSSGSIGFGENSEYQLQALGEGSNLNFAASRAVDSRLIVNQSVNLESGKAYTLLVTGEVGLYTLVRVFQDY